MITAATAAWPAGESKTFDFYTDSLGEIFLEQKKVLLDGTATEIRWIWKLFRPGKDGGERWIAGSEGKAVEERKMLKDLAQCKTDLERIEDTRGKNAAKSKVSA